MSNETQPKHESREDASPAVEAVVKKPYVAPRLRLLGSVRELTLGSGADVLDGAATQQP